MTKKKGEEAMNKKILAVVLSAAILMISTVVAFAKGQTCEEAVGAAYTMTNDSTGNEVVVFNRDVNGILTKVGTISTGGDGSGSQGTLGGLDSLGSQGSLVLSRDQRWLLAVNAGSNEISVFRVVPDGLKLVDKVSSGGKFPVSLTILEDLVYVLNTDFLNAGASPNITGFNLSDTGQLTPLANSTRSLSKLSMGMFGQVGFNPEGDIFVVTDKANNNIIVFSIDDNGLPSMNAVTSPSNGTTPFGFIFDHRGHLLVVEAGTNAVSSYEILPDDTLQVISPSVPDNQQASCWIQGTERGLIFTTNPGSSSISSFRLNAGKGTLSLLNGTAGMGTTPLDFSIVQGRFLYALDPKSGGIDMFKIQNDGSLTNLGTVAGGLSIHAQGLTAR
jgi:6-phosphogluconolactonase (cycloisomerase 2 family)